MRSFIIGALSLAAVACSGFQGTASQPLDLKKGDVSNGTVAGEHQIDSDTSNWNDFLKEAKGALGQDPAVITVTSASIQLDAAKAKNVGKYEDVLKGECTLYFHTTNPEKLIDVARITDPTGTNALALDLLGADLGDQKDKLLKGDFAIGLRGTSVKGEADDFDLPLVVNLGLEAK